MPKYVAKEGARGHVYLDGTLIKDVSECDTDEGYVIRAVRDKETGFILANPENHNETILTERLTGVVTFEAL